MALIYTADKWKLLDDRAPVHGLEKFKFDNISIRPSHIDAIIEGLYEELTALESAVGGGGGGDYISYRALLTQVGEAAPTASVLEDEIVGTYTYVAPGHYQFRSVGAFTDANKVEVSIENAQVLALTMSNDVFHVISATRLDANTITIKTGTVKDDGFEHLIMNGNSADTFTLNDILLNTPFVIRVWS